MNHKTLSWLGAIISMIAYTLNIFGFISSTGILYPILNFISAILLGFLLFKNNNKAQFSLNLFFGTISLVAPIKYLL